MTRRLAPPLCCAVSSRRTLRLASLLAVLLATCTAALGGAAKLTSPSPAAPAAASPTAVTQGGSGLLDLTKLPAGAVAAPTPTSAGTGELPARGLTPATVAQLAPAAAPGLSAAELIDQAFDYEWYGDLAATRACLEAAAACPATKETGLALALLVERAAGDASGMTAQAALDQVRTEYSDPEVRAFADMEQAVSQAPDEAGRVAVLEGYLAKHEGTLTGGWVALRLANVYIDRMETAPRALELFESTAAQYAGTVIGDEGILGIADTKRRRGLGASDAIEVYSALVANTISDRVRRWAVEGMANRLMGLRQWQAAYDLLSDYTARWPLYARYACFVLRVEAAMPLGLADSLEQELRDTLPSVPGSWYRSQGHYLLGAIALGREEYEKAEEEFAAATDQVWLVKGLAAIAQCRTALGDDAGAITALLQAADIALNAGDKATYLYGAARAAERAGDAAAWDRIVARMTAEVPGSYLTSRLVGHDVLPPPDI